MSLGWSQADLQGSSSPNRLIKNSCYSHEIAAFCFWSTWYLVWWLQYCEYRSGRTICTDLATEKVCCFTFNFAIEQLQVFVQLIICWLDWLWFNGLFRIESRVGTWLNLTVWPILVSKSQMQKRLNLDPWVAESFNLLATIPSDESIMNRSDTFSMRKLCK